MAVEDRAGPVLTSLTFSQGLELAPTNYPSVTVTAAATDAGTGVDHVSIDLDRARDAYSPYSPLSGPPDAFTRLTIDNSSGSFLEGPQSASTTFNVSNGGGTFGISQVTVFDKAGNATIYEPTQLAAMGIATSLTFPSPAGVISDDSRPLLTSLTLPTSVVASVDGTHADFIATATDVGSGVAGVLLDFDHDFSVELTSDSNGALTTSLTFGATSLPATYQLKDAIVADRAGNFTTYNAAQLKAMGTAESFMVANPAVTDNVAPVLTALSIPTNIDLSHGSGYAPISANIIETGAGVASITLQLSSDVTLNYGYQWVPHGGTLGGPILVNQIEAFPAARDFYGSTLTLAQSDTTYRFTYGGATNGQQPSDVLISALTAAGTYHVTGATITDAAGNSAVYNEAQLQALGANTTITIAADASKPTLTSLNVPSMIVASGSGATQTTFAIAGLDDGTGLATAQVHFSQGVAPHIGSTLGNSYVLFNAFSNGMAATATEAVGSPNPPSGDYNILDVLLTDGGGNQTLYTADEIRALGINTKMTAVSAGDLSIVAPNANLFYAGTVGQDTLRLNGNVGDYVLSRIEAQPKLGSSQIEGDFVLTAINGSGAYAIGESIETIRFQNGQYLSLHDLPAYVAGNAALSIGGNQDDLMYQVRPAGYDVFAGGTGVDRVFVNGNVSDYTVHPFIGVSDAGGTSLQGLELISRNGSGALLVDASTETVQFRDGQYLSFGDVQNFVEADRSPVDAVLHVIANGAQGATDIIGTASNDRLLLDGEVGDYSLSRSPAGAFVLTGGPHNAIVEESIDTVQFGNGQYLSLRDLPAYLAGNAVFTTGSAADDLLFAGRSGDQYLVGAGGNDSAYINGNVQDYHLAEVHTAATASSAAIDGYELSADNGSGNLYVDRSTEIIHFQDGQYLAFNDLPSYIHDLHL